MCLRLAVVATMCLQLAEVATMCLQLAVVATMCIYYLDVLREREGTRTYLIFQQCITLMIVSFVLFVLLHVSNPELSGSS